MLERFRSNWLLMSPTWLFGQNRIDLSRVMFWGSSAMPDLCHFCRALCHLQATINSCIGTLDSAVYTPVDSLKFKPVTQIINHSCNPSASLLQIVLSDIIGMVDEFLAQHRNAKTPGCAQIQQWHRCFSFIFFHSDTDKKHQRKPLSWKLQRTLLNRLQVLGGLASAAEEASALDKWTCIWECLKTQNYSKHGGVGWGSLDRGLDWPDRRGWIGNLHWLGWIGTA